MRLGLVGHSHSDTCRNRIEAKLAESAAGRERLAKAKARLDEAYYRMTKDDAEPQDARAECPGGGKREVHESG